MFKLRQKKEDPERIKQVFSKLLNKTTFIKMES